MSKHDSGDLAADQDTTGRTVVGMFTNRPDAESAIRELKAAGFGEDRIGVALQDSDRIDSTKVAGNLAAGGAATGAVSGGLVGGLIGLLGSLLIPGVGPIVVGGVLTSTLAGAGIGAATGGIIGALVGLGVPETDARHFDEGLRSGRTLVTVDAGARTPEALAILDRHGMDFGPSGARRYEILAVEVEGPVDVGFTEERSRAGDAERYRGRERRVARDAMYAGPERRLAGV
jgi:hypothetical protein